MRAINNGLTPEEIREVFIHAAIYCGVPAALEATRIEGEVLKEMATDPGDSAPTPGAWLA